MYVKTKPKNTHVNKNMQRLFYYDVRAKCNYIYYSIMCMQSKC